MADNPATSTEQPDSPIPASSNPAVAYCLKAYNEAYQATFLKKKSEYHAEMSAKAAYLSALPPLSGSRNIRDHVACVAHAMAIKALEGADGARLLYAAQVASTAQSTQRRVKAKSNAITERKPWENMQLPNIEFPIKLAE